MDDKHLGTELKAAIGDLKHLASQLVDTSRDWWQQRRIEMNQNYRQDQDNERTRRQQRGYGEGYGTQHAGTRESRAWDESDFAERGSGEQRYGYGNRYQDEYGQGSGRQYANRSGEAPTYRGYDEAEFYSGRGSQASDRSGYSPYRDESLGGARFGGGFGSSGYGSSFGYGYGSGYREGAGMAQGETYGDNYGRGRSEERGLTGNTGYSQGRSGSPWYADQDMGQRPQGGYARQEYGTGSTTYGQMGQSYAGQYQGQYGQSHYGSGQGQYGLSSQGQSYGDASGYGQSQNRYGYGASGSQGYQQHAGFRGRGPRDYKRSDERITEDLNERLTDDNDLDASNINVRVSDGVATLTGTVDSRWMKHRAEDIADNCSGVKDVRNEIRVSSESQQSMGQSAGSQSGYGQSTGSATGQDGNATQDKSTPPTPTSTTGGRSGGNIAH